jgi:hypothetical protein
MGQAIEQLLAPILAGALLGAIGMKGIITIDLVTYLFAIGALFLVRIPQPEAPAPTEEGDRGRVLQDILYGWRYLYARAGLFGLLLYFALVNFLLNTASVLTGPLVLSFGTATTLGLVQTVSGVGMLVGSVAMSAWGGPKRRINGVIGFIALAALGLVFTGLRPSGLFAAGGMFLLLFCVPFASGSSRAIFQSKVDPAVQGRVFAARGMISRSMTPIAFAIAGPLADYVFEPWMAEGGLLAGTFLGRVLGVGAGRGIGLMFLVSGTVLVASSAWAYAHPRIRRVEEELPDAIPDEGEVEEAAAGEEGPIPAEPEPVPAD